MAKFLIYCVNILLLNREKSAPLESAVIIIIIIIMVVIITNIMHTVTLNMNVMFVVIS